MSCWTNNLILIYISGIDGCGKTTQAKLLEDHLLKAGFSVQYQWLRWSPSFGKAVGFIRRLPKICAGETSKKTIDLEPENIEELQKFENKTYENWLLKKQYLLSKNIISYFWSMYAFRDYCSEIRKESQTWNTDIVILDRYVMDFAIDQAINFGETLIEFEKRLQSSCLNHVHPTDLTVIIDIPPEMGWSRKRDGTSISRLKLNRGYYKSIENGENVYFINGSCSMDEVKEKIQHLVARVVKERNAFQL